MANAINQNDFMKNFKFLWLCFLLFCLFTVCFFILKKCKKQNIDELKIENNITPQVIVKETITQSVVDSLQSIIAENKKQIIWLDLNDSISDVHIANLRANINKLLRKPPLKDTGDNFTITIDCEATIDLLQNEIILLNDAVDLRDLEIWIP